MKNIPNGVPFSNKKKGSDSAGVDIQAREDITSLNEQLAQKVPYDEARLKSIKLELEDMSENTLGAMSGNATFNLLSIPQNESVGVQQLKGAKNVNYFNPDEQISPFIDEGYYLMSGSLAGGGTANYFVSSKLSVTPGVEYSISPVWKAAGATNRGAAYKKDGTYISDIDASPFVAPTDASYVRFTVSKTYTWETAMMVIGGTLPSEYIPYGAEVPWIKMPKVDEKLKKIDPLFNLKYTNARVALIGDSLTGNNMTNWSIYPTWFTKYTNNNHMVYVKGVPGQTSTQIADRFDADVVANKPTHVVICAGKNNIQSPSTILADITTMVNKAIAAGIIPIVCNIIQYGNVSGGTVYNSADLELTNTANTQIKAYCDENNILFVDLYNALLDVSDLYSTDKYMLSDNLHPNHYGASIMAKTIADVFFQGSLADNSYNADGNLFKNSEFILDSNADGVPDFFTLSTSGSPTYSTSIVNLGYPKMMKMKFNSDVASKVALLQTIPVTSGAYEFSMDIFLEDITIDPSQSSGLKVYLYDTVSWQERKLVDFLQSPTEKKIRVYMDFTVAEGVNNLYFEGGLRSCFGGTVYFSRPVLRKIV